MDSNTNPPQEPTTSPQPQVIQPTQPVTTPVSAPTTPTPSSTSNMPAGTFPVGVSASQMGINGPKRGFSSRSLIKALLIVVVLGGIVAALIVTNIIPLKTMQRTTYTSTDGTQYSLLFYAKHSTTTTKSGATQLVSKLLRDGNYPVNLLISTADDNTYSSLHTCTRQGFSKAFEVQNNALHQTIVVCNVSLGQSAPEGVYIAGATHNNKTSIITISQDLSGLDLSSASGAQKSLAKFGLDPYQDDIKSILASLSIQ